MLQAPYSKWVVIEFHRGHGFIKLLGSGDSKTVLKSEEFEIPESALSDGRLLDPSYFEKTWTPIFRRMELKQKDLKITLHFFSIRSSLRKLDLAKEGAASEDRLAAIALEKYNYDVEKYHQSFYRYAGNRQSSTQWAFLATPRVDVLAFDEMLHHFNFQVAVIEITVYCLPNLLAEIEKRPNGFFLGVHLACDRLQLMYIRDHEILALDECAPSNFGDDSDASVVQAMDYSWGKVGNLNAFLRASDLSEILVSCAEDVKPQLIESVQAHYGIPVNWVGPYRGFHSRDEMEDLKALRKKNESLVKKTAKAPLQQSKKAARVKLSAGVWACLIAIVLVALYAFVSPQGRKLMQAKIKDQVTLPDLAPEQYQKMLDRVEKDRERSLQERKAAE